MQRRWPSRDHFSRPAPDEGRRGRAPGGHTIDTPPPTSKLLVDPPEAGYHYRAAILPVGGDQVGIGVRYQRPLNHALIFRADAMFGHRSGEDNVSGLRLELRYKF